MIFHLIAAGAKGALEYPTERVLSFDDVYNMVALFYASREGNQQHCMELLEKNAESNLRDKERLTPLYFA